MMLRSLGDVPMSTNFTDQYTEMVQQNQEAVRTAVGNWTKTV